MALKTVRLSLLARLTIALIAVAVIPLAAAVWSLIDVNREGIREQVRRTHALAASTAAERIAAAVELRRTSAAALAANRQLIDAPRDAGAQQLLEQHLVSDPAIRSIVVSTPANELVLRVQRRGVPSFPIGPTMAPELRDDVLRTSAPFEDGRGIVHVFTEAGPLLAALHTKEIGEDAEIALFSPAGHIAGHPGSEALPENVKALAQSSSVNGTSVYRDGRGREVMSAYAAVSGTNWFVVSRQPAEVAQRLVTLMRRRAALATLLALVLAGAIALLARRTVIRPILEVVHAQQKLAGTVAEGGSEIDQLRQSAEFLQRRIADQEDLGRVFLGRYQVLGLIGQGGMGTVFRGWDPKLHRAVALKTVHLDASPDAHSPAAVRSLVAEAVTIAGFNHPNIVSVYDADESAGAAFIAMELIDGVSLDTYLAGGPLSAEQTLLVGLHVGRALAAAHAHGVLHRDIKPANILLGREDSIKVADFGLAQPVSQAAEASEFIYGTPGYMAPEAISGTACDSRADLFSLGVMLYECATGDPPFARGGFRETFAATIHSPVTPLADRLPISSASVALSEIVASLMNKIPGERPSSASTIVERIDTIARFLGLEWRAGVAGDEPSQDGGRRSGSLLPTAVVERN